MSIIIVDDLGTIPAAPAGYDLALIQGVRSAPTAVPQRSIAIPRADVAGLKYGTILYDGSGVALKYLGADGSWHPVIATKGATAHKFLTSYDQTTGLLQNGQPAATDLSDFTLASLAAGDRLAYDGISAWKNRAVLRRLCFSAAVTGLGALTLSTQVDYDGTIIGGHIYVDAGTINIDLCRHANAAPPAAPVTPNTTTDKISASAPVQVSSGTSASIDVSTWITGISKWDSLLLNVTFSTGVGKVQGIILIQEK